MDKVVLYTINCAKCKVLELKLNKAGINFTVVADVDTVVAVGQEHNINGAPILQVGESFLDFTNAAKYINERK